jgi:hypothetical protein
MAKDKEVTQTGQKKGQANTSAGKGARPSKPVDTRVGTIVNTRQAGKGKGAGNAGSGGRSRDGSR